MAVYLSSKFELEATTSIDFENPSALASAAGKRSRRKDREVTQRAAGAIGAGAIERADANDPVQKRVCHELTVNRTPVTTPVEGAQGCPEKVDKAL